MNCPSPFPYLCNVVQRYAALPISKAAKDIQDITDCKKLVGYHNIYRIRLGDYRALFTLEIEFSGDTIFFQYLAPRGEAYGKKMKTELKRIDKE